MPPVAARFVAVLRDIADVATATVASTADVLDRPDVEAVVVAARRRERVSLARAAVAAGKHVWMRSSRESPCEPDRSLLRAAAEAGRVFFVGSPLSCDAGVLEVERLIRAGVLGEIYHVAIDHLGRVRHGGRAGPGARAVDAVELMLWLADRPIQAARLRHRQAGGSQGVVFGDLEFDGGASGHLYVSGMHPEPVLRLGVVGRERMLAYERRGMHALLSVVDYTIVRGDRYDTVSTGARRVAWRSSDHLGVTAREFVAAVRSGGPTRAVRGRTLAALRIVDDAVARETGE